jgi:hypothetical protein
VLLEGGISNGHVEHCQDIQLLNLSGASHIQIKSLKLLFVAIGVSFALTKSAHAYIDPGTGSLALQALAAIGIGALFYIRSIGQAFKKLFKRNPLDDINRDVRGE